MTAFDKINNKKVVFFTYFQLLDLFLDHKNILKLNQAEYLKYLEDIQWETDYHVYTFSVLKDIEKLISNGQLQSNLFAWFDQNASGPSIISILSNSEKLAHFCNIITVRDKKMDYETLTRNCIYSEFLKHCNDTIPGLNNNKFSDFKFDRKWAKYILMTHYYNAGLKTAARLSSEWIIEKDFDDIQIKKYEEFFNKQSSVIKGIKKALLSFCPQGTKLADFFRKVAIILVCDKTKFKSLTEIDRQVIFELRKELLKEGVPKNDTERFFGFGFCTLRIVTPFGTKLQYSTLDKNPALMKQFTSYKAKSGSAFEQFQNSRARLFDYKQLIGSFLVNFIHSCDASILQQLVKWFHTKYPDKTIATVQDCFGTDFALINETSKQIKYCYYQLGFDDQENLINKCIIEPNFRRGIILKKSDTDGIYLENLTHPIMKILNRQFSEDFPKKNNILVKHETSVINSCYWYPYSD